MVQNRYMGRVLLVDDDENISRLYDNILMVPSVMGCTREDGTRRRVLP